MTRQKPQGKAAVVAAIMTATARLISERGVNRVTLRDIARKANVNLALINRHFGSKEKLVKAVGLHMLNSMLEDAKKREANLLDSLVDVENKYTMNIRTVVRIMLDDPGKNVILDAKPLIDSFMDWIREKQMKQRINPGFDPIALVFIYACIVFGDELFGPYLRKIMKIPADAYQRLRPKIFQAIISGLHEPSIPYD